jgi:hypothetical protein
MQGIFKDTSLDEAKQTDEDDQIKIFYQVARAKDRRLHVYTPMHAACETCIQKIKSIMPARCHICREELSEHTEPSHAARTRETPHTGGGRGHSASPAFQASRSYLDDEILVARSVTPQRIDPDDFFYRSLPRATTQHLTRGASFTRDAIAYARSVEEDELTGLLDEASIDREEGEAHSVTPPRSYSDHLTMTPERRRVNFSGMSRGTIDQIKSIMLEEGLSGRHFYQEQASLLRQAPSPAATEDETHDQED